MSLYNRTAIEDFTRANADDLNTELAKIKAAIDALEAQVNGLEIEGAAPRFTWVAFADSDDGTVDFSHEPGNRAYLGLAENKLVETPSDFPEDYTWALIRGSDAPTLRLVASASRFDFDSDDNSTGVSEILFTAEATNISTTIAFTAENDSGNAVSLTTVNDEQVKLDVDDFGDADWVRVVATADGGAVSDSLLITARREPNELDWRGKWNPATTYGKNDMVSYLGHSFISLHAENTGNTPDDGEDSAWWGVMARGGDVGDPATPDSAYSQTINLTTSTGTVNLARLARQDGYRRKADATINFVVPAGVVITGRPDGGVAIDTGDWPDEEHAVTLTLTVENGGVVRGGGGNGGRGPGVGRSRGKGGDGGDAIYCRADIDITIDAGGEVSGGGGGGDAADSEVSGWPVLTGTDAGGGGGGFPNGEGGTSFGPGGTDGLDGTIAGGGLGGTPDGTDGGDAGAAAATGGAGGYAVRKNGNTVTVTNNGTANGTIG